MRNTKLGLALTFSTLAFSFATAIAPKASATQNFPAAVQGDLSLAKTPDCILCHADDNGGIGTVVKPFGQSARNHGLVEYDEGKLKTVLAAMAADGTDSDGDCVGDIDELKAGTDPNTIDHPVPCDAGTPPTGQPAQPSIEEPRYGCGAHIAPSNDGSETLGVFAVGGIAAVVFASRRKRR